MEAGIQHGHELAFEMAIRVVGTPQGKADPAVVFRNLAAHHRAESSKSFGRALRELKFVTPKPTRISKLARALGGAISGARRGWSD